MIQNGTKQYLFEISQNYIIACFSSPFILNFCTQNDTQIMTVHIWKTKIFIISVSKFKKYISKNCCFHIVSYQIDIESYLIVSYHYFVLILWSRPSFLSAENNKTFALKWSHLIFPKDLWLIFNTCQCNPGGLQLGHLTHAGWALHGCSVSYCKRIKNFFSVRHLRFGKVS